MRFLEDKSESLRRFARWVLSPKGGEGGVGA